MISMTTYHPTSIAPETSRRADPGVIETPPTRKYLRQGIKPFSSVSGRSVMDTIRTRMAKLRTPLLSFLSQQQADAVKAAVDETSDLIVILPTGGGKTAGWDRIDTHPCYRPLSRSAGSW